MTGSSITSELHNKIEPFGTDLKGIGGIRSPVNAKIKREEDSKKYNK